jgi:uncharacterized membrane protein YdjX (TVP38/TMEM64 family)
MIQPSPSPSQPVKSQRMKFKIGAALVTVLCIVAPIAVLIWLGGIEPDRLQALLRAAGWWAPLAYMALYTLATLLLLPSTALNLTGGAIFGFGWGLLWTTVAAVVAAIAAFAFSRTIGHQTVAQRLAGRWQAMDAEVKRGGLFYIFALRLLPIMPYGLVNFAAGLTSVKFRDYLVGTCLGTVPGILPFVLMGSSGLRAVQRGEVMPVLVALGLLGLLVAGATWYRRGDRQR